MDGLQDYTENEFIHPEDPETSRTVFWVWGGACTVAVTVLVFAITLLLPPKEFPQKSFLKVTPGESVADISEQAASLHLVKSPLLLKTLVEILGGDRHMVSGYYYFSSPVTVVTLARHLATGNFDIKQVKVTFYEGMTRQQMADILTPNLPFFNASDFMAKTQDKEGFLFPDTYFISPATDTDEVISLLENNYEVKIFPLRADIAATGMSEHDVITLASIIEKETSGSSDRAIIAGIMLTRLKRRIPLEVDAPFLYALNKTSSQLSPADLKVDSPYNTYIRKGLPPGPIGNPGMLAIQAVLHPTMTKYLFYLHDRDGVPHYAQTFAEHKRNIRLYLIH